MGTTAIIVLLSLFANSLCAHATPVDYQPIRITVNENFNAQPGEVVPNFVRQGANFYFNPQVQLPVGILAPDIEALLTSPYQKYVSTIVNRKPVIVFRGDEIIEEAKPYQEIEFDNNAAETIKLTEIPRPSSLEVINELPLPGSEPMFGEEMEVVMPFVSRPEINVQEDVIATNYANEISLPEPIALIPEPVEVSVEDVALPPLPVPLPIHDEPIIQEPIIEELVDIPEAPKLPPLSTLFIPPIEIENIKVEEPINLEPLLVEKNNNDHIYIEEPIEIIHSLPEIPTGPTLRPIVVPEFQESEILQSNPKPEDIILLEEKITPVLNTQVELLDSEYINPKPILTRHYDTMPIRSEIKDYRILRNFQETFGLKNKVRAAIPFPKRDDMLRPMVVKKNKIACKTGCTDIVVESIAPNKVLKERFPELSKLRYLPKA